MINYIPSQQSKKFKVSYTGDFFGNIINAFNLDLFSARGKARTGAKIYPHTLVSDITGITPSSSFVSAEISDGSTTPRKIWAVSDSKKIVRSLASTLPVFTLDTATGFRSGEDTGTGSDLITVKDDSGSTIDNDNALSLTGDGGFGDSDADIFGAVGTKEMQATSFTGVSGPLLDINFKAKKTGSPTDDLVVELQSNNAGSPSGTVLASSTLGAASLTTSYAARRVVLTPYQLDPDVTYWIVFSRSGARDATNFVSITQLNNTLNETGVVGKTRASGSWSENSGAHNYIILDIQFPVASERLYLSTNNDIRFLNVENGVWQSLWRGICGQAALDTAYPHPIKNIGSGGLILVGDDNLLHSVIATAVSSADATNSRLVLPESHYINWIEVTKSAVFIGMEDKSSATLPSIVCYYEPLSEVTRLFYIQEGSTRGFIVNENCQIIDKSGQIRTFTGSEFRITDHLPPYFTSQSVTLPHRNAFLTRNSITRFLWEGVYPYGAGIWTIEDGNLYHRNSLVFSKTALNSYGAIDGVTSRALYYTGTYYVLGATMKDNSLATIQGIFSDFNVDASPVSTESRGYFKTSKFTSSGTNSTWQKILAKIDSRRSGSQTGSVVLKRRIEKPTYIEGNGATAYSGTWTSSTTFTCATASFITEVDNGTIGTDDEVTIRTGQGCGLLAHISSITGGVGATKTITLNEGLAAISSGSMTFSVENWRLVTNKTMIAKTSEWLEAKVEIRGSVDLEELQIGSTPNQNVDEA